MSGHQYANIEPSGKDSKIHAGDKYKFINSSGGPIYFFNNGNREPALIQEELRHAKAQLVGLQAYINALEGLSMAPASALSASVDLNRLPRPGNFTDQRDGYIVMKFAHVRQVYGIESGARDFTFELKTGELDFKAVVSRVVLKALNQGSSSASHKTKQWHPHQWSGKRYDMSSFASYSRFVVCIYLKKGWICTPWESESGLTYEALDITHAVKIQSDSLSFDWWYDKCPSHQSIRLDFSIRRCNGHDIATERKLECACGN